MIEYQGEFYPASNHGLRSLKLYVSSDPVVDGTECRLAVGKVLQTLGEGEFIAHAASTQIWRHKIDSYHARIDRVVVGETIEATYHVEGWDGPAPGEGRDVNGELVYIGDYQYETAGNATKVVPNFVPYQKISKEQFRDALDTGFPLVTVNIIPCRNGEKTKGAVLLPDGQPKGRWYRVVRRPVK